VAYSWKSQGLKVFLFNFLSFGITFGIWEVSVWFLSDPVATYTTAGCGILAIGVSIIYWFRMGKTLVGTKSTLWKFALLSSSFYWLLFIFTIIGFLITENFWTAGGLFIVATISFIATLVCTFVIRITGSKVSL
jgi:hypothetical protein